MDVFRLLNTGSTWGQGDIISGLKTKVWSERYRSAGEFTFTGIPTKALMDSMPLGALLSHTNTLDVMMLENIEIEEKIGTDSKVTFSGRSLEAFLENRVATEHHMGFLNPVLTPPGPLYDGSPWPYMFNNSSERSQIVDVIRSGIESGYTSIPGFVLPHTHVVQQIAEAGPLEDREIKRGDMYRTVLELLADMGAGLKIARPSGARTDIWWIVHDGDDLRSDVQFSHDAGDLESSKYFKTIKSDKDTAYINASYWYMFYQESSPGTGFERRAMHIDATDVKPNPADDGVYGFITKGEIENVLSKRAKRILRAKKRNHILEATVSKHTNYKYREHYNIGDLVYAIGKYDIKDVMRVVEFVETDDESGESGYPTLVRYTS